MTERYHFPCGCSWPIIGPPPVPGALPRIDVDLENLPFCQATWDLLATGRTKGVFQLESPLGKQWTKRLKPRCAEHLSALGATLRPGCLKALDENKVSLTEHYCRRANNEEPVEYFLPCLEDILKDSYGLAIYQELAMKIAEIVAGFTPMMADVLRRAIGKKKPEEMSKLREGFMEGARKVGLATEEQAKQLFDWIQEGQRYSFNHSHSMTYGLTGYDTAYCKAHFPVEKFAGDLLNAHAESDPRTEIRELVEDARFFNIPVEPPDIVLRNPYFWTDGLKIYFGLTDIKGLGLASVTKILAQIDQGQEEKGKPIRDWTWTEVLCHLAGGSVFPVLISVGAFRYWRMPRKLQLHQAELLANLSPGERKWLVKTQAEYVDQTLIDHLIALARPKGEGGGCQNEKRIHFVLGIIHSLIHPPEEMVDLPWWLAAVETKYLGVALTCSKVDSCDLTHTNSTCREFLEGKQGCLLLGVEVKDVRELKIKNGDNKGAKFGRLVLADSSGMIDDAVVWPELWEKTSSLVTPGNTVIVQGERSPKSGSFIVSRVWQI